jgi:hypothetical protein
MVRVLSDENDANAECVSPEQELGAASKQAVERSPVRGDLYL